MEIKRVSVALELKHLLNIQAVDNFTQMEVKVSFFLFIFKRLVVFDNLQNLNVLPDQFLKNFLTVRRFFIVQDLLGL
jgi:hypothetical protein